MSVFNWEVFGTALLGSKLYRARGRTVSSMAKRWRICIRQVQRLSFKLKLLWNNMKQPLKWVHKHPTKKTKNLPSPQTTTEVNLYTKNDAKPNPTPNPIFDIFDSFISINSSPNSPWSWENSISDNGQRQTDTMAMRECLSSASCIHRKVAKSSRIRVVGNFHVVCLMENLGGGC